MAERLGRALLELITDDRAFLDGVERAHNRATVLGARLDQIGQKARTLGKTLSVAVTAPLALFARQAVLAATDAGELQSAFDFSFGAMSKEMNEWARTTGDALGRSTQALQSQAFTFNQLFKAAAPTGEQAAELSRDFTLLAQDLSSFFNVTEDDALQKLRAGLVGEAEPLRAFGVFLNAAEVEAKALQLGLADANGEISEQAKILARAAVVMEQTRDAQGDLARTADSASNQQRALSAAWQELSVTVGQHLLPALTPLVTKLADILNGFSALDPGMQQMIVVAGAVAAAIGPLVGGLGLMLSGIGALIPAVVTLTALIAAISAPVWAAVAAVTALVAIYVRYHDVSDEAMAQMPAWEQFFAASARGWNMIFTAIGRAISAITTYLGLANDSRTLSTMLSNAVEEQRTAEKEQLEELSNVRDAAGQDALLTQFGRENHARELRIEDLQKRLSEATAEPFDPSKAIQLPGVEAPAVSVPDTPAGGSGGGKRRGGKSKAAETDEWTRALGAAADAIARVRQETEELGLTEPQVARLRLETDLLAAAEAKYGTVTDETRLGIEKLGEQIEIATAIKVASREETARLAAEERALEQAAEESARELRQIGAEITGPLRDALSGGIRNWQDFADRVVQIGQSLASRLFERVFRPVEDAIGRMLEGLLGGGGGGGFLSRLLGGGGGLVASTSAKSLTGGPILKGFANGGWAEGWAMVGERGPEPVYLGQGGRVMSNEDMQGALAGAGQPIIQILTRDPDTQIRMKPSAATAARNLRRVTGTGGAY